MTGIQRGALRESDRLSGPIGALPALATIASGMLALMARADAVPVAWLIAFLGAAGISLLVLIHSEVSGSVRLFLIPLLAGLAIGLASKSDFFGTRETAAAIAVPVEAQGRMDPYHFTPIKPAVNRDLGPESSTDLVIRRVRESITDTKGITLLLDKDTSDENGMYWGLRLAEDDVSCGRMTVWGGAVEGKVSLIVRAIERAIEMSTTLGRLTCG